MSDMSRRLDRAYSMIWREDRLEDALRGLRPDFEWIVQDHPEGELRHGPEGVMEFFREWIEPFDDLHVDWEILELTPERALVITTMRGRGHGSGAPVEMHFGQLWTFQQGEARRMVAYLDVDEARREAGL
jgi:ketosteroid isomerase-like protein